MALKGRGGTDEKCTTCGKIVTAGNTNRFGECRQCREKLTSDVKAWRRINRKVGRTNDL